MLSRAADPVAFDLRKQQSSRLRLDLERRHPARLGLEDQRVALRGRLVDLHQVGRPRARREQRERDSEREDRAFLVHALTVWRPGRPGSTSVVVDYITCRVTG